MILDLMVEIGEEEYEIEVYVDAETLARYIFIGDGFDGMGKHTKLGYIQAVSDAMDYLEVALAQDEDFKSWIETHTNLLDTEIDNIKEELRQRSNYYVDL